MQSKDAQTRSPRLHHIDTAPDGGVSGPFWDSADRCFWLMNNLQIYNHPEGYSGSSACATIASPDPHSAYPTGWSKGQRTRSLSGSDASPNSASHEYKRIRPDSFSNATPGSTKSKQPPREGTQEQQRKYPQYDLSNLPPPPPFPAQRSQSVRFSPNISYSDDPLKKQNPNPSKSSFPQRSQSVRSSSEHDRGFTRSSHPSPTPPPSSSHSHQSPPTRTQSFSHSNSNSNSKSASASSPTFKSITTSHTTSHIAYSTLPPSTRYNPPKYVRDPEYEDEDFSSPSSATSAYSYTKSPLTPRTQRSPSSRDRHSSQSQRTHRRRIEYDFDTDSDDEKTTQKEKKLIRQECTRQRTPDEQKKNEEALKDLGKTGRGDMGRAVVMGALPLLCFFARLAN